MKGMPWITLTIFSIIFSCSTSPERSLINEKNINKIRIGMKLNQVKEIMGKPDQTRH